MKTRIEIYNDDGNWLLYEGDIINYEGEPITEEWLPMSGIKKITHSEHSKGLKKFWVKLQ